MKLITSIVLPIVFLMNQQALAQCRKFNAVATTNGSIYIINTITGDVRSRVNGYNKRYGRFDPPGQGSNWQREPAEDCGRYKLLAADNNTVFSFDTEKGTFSAIIYGREDSFHNHR